MIIMFLMEECAFEWIFFNPSGHIDFVGYHHTQYILHNYINTFFELINTFGTCVQNQSQKPLWS